MSRLLLLHNHDWIVRNRIKTPVVLLFINQLECFAGVFWLFYIRPHGKKRSIVHEGQASAENEQQSTKNGSK